MKQKDMYTLEELYDNLKISLSKLSKIADVNEGTLIRIRKGQYSVRKTTVNKLLDAFSQIYGIELSLDNVSGIRLEDKKGLHTQVTDESEKTSVSPTQTQVEKPQKRPYNRRKDTGLPEGAMLATDFAKKHEVNERTFYGHMLIGLGPGTVPGEIGDPMLPVKEQVDYSERDKPGRKGEKERYLTQEQQEKALAFWRKHNVTFTMPKQEK